MCMISNGIDERTEATSVKSTEARPGPKQTLGDNINDVPAGMKPLWQQGKGKKTRRRISYSGSNTEGTKNHQGRK